MKKFSFRSVLPLICAFSIVVSLCTISCSAIWYGDDVEDFDSASAIDAKMRVPSGWDINIAIGSFNFLDLNVGDTFKDFAWGLIDDTVDSMGVGEMSLVELQTVAARYTSFFNHSPSYTFAGALVNGTSDIANNLLCFTLFGKMGLTFEVRSWSKMQYKRIYCPELDVFVSSSAGRYAYVNEGYAETSGGAQWVPISSMGDSSVKKNVLDYAQLYNVAITLGYMLFLLGNEILSHFDS